MGQVKNRDVYAVFKGSCFYKFQSIVRDVYHSLVNVFKRVLFYLGYVVLRQIEQLKFGR